VCLVDDGKLPKVDYSLPNGSVIDLVTFNTNTLQKAFKKLKSNTASGQDDLPQIMFIHLSGCLAEPLSLMCTSFMSVGEVPGDWQKAIITPIHKSGLASVVPNYLPIALTRVACKIMERIIVENTLKFLKEHNIINKEQHGFLAGKSTITNLLDFLNDWTLSHHHHHHF